METKDINQLIKKYSLNIEAFEQVRKDYLDKSTSIQEGNKIFLRNDEEANMAFARCTPNKHYLFLIR